MEKFRKCQFADVGKSELGKKEIKKKHARNIRSTVHRTGDLITIRPEFLSCRIFLNLLSCIVCTSVFYIFGPNPSSRVRVTD